MSTVKDLVEILKVLKLVIGIPFATLRFDVYINFQPAFNVFGFFSIQSSRCNAILNLSFPKITFILKQTYETDCNGVSRLTSCISSWSALIWRKKNQFNDKFVMKNRNFRKCTLNFPPLKTKTKCFTHSQQNRKLVSKIRQIFKNKMKQNGM